MTDLQVLQKARALAMEGNLVAAFWLGCYAVDMNSGDTNSAAHSLENLRNLVGE